MKTIAEGRCGTKRSCWATARPPARARRRTRRAGSGLELEGVRAAFVRQQPALRLEQVARGGVRKAAEAIGRHDAVAGNDDRQPVVAAGLAYRARLSRQAPGELAISKGPAARNLAQRVPQATLERRALDEQRQVEACVGVLAVALELPGGALGQRISRGNRVG